jgi:MTH538 TIR-like domain (DUF1863)
MISGGRHVPRRVFYSFHYDNDCWRTQQVRNIGFIEGNKPVSANDWESVKRGGDAAIKTWIKNQLAGRSCTVVLIGTHTAYRPWVIHEIVESWNERKGVVGIRVHQLKDQNGYQSLPGQNPFAQVNVNGRTLDTIARTYGSTSGDSKETYEFISNGISKWIEEAIQIRDNFTSAD